jgi:hypothetical protein
MYIYIYLSIYISGSCSTQIHFLIIPKVELRVSLPPPLSLVITQTKLSLTISAEVHG